jgi:hypothetical protein
MAPNTAATNSKGCDAGKVVVDIPEPQSCKHDSDCVNTCGWGSVNWLTEKLLMDTCDDGCASSDMTSKCIENSCKTFYENGREANSCNNLKFPAQACVDQVIYDDINRCGNEALLIRTFDRFECETDDDCSTSCTYGAINSTWGEKLYPDCSDGCAGKGLTAGCKGNRCVTYDQKSKAIVPGCTNVVAPRDICVAKEK